MAAKYEDLRIDQGADALVEIRCVDENGNKKDLSGYSVSAKMKRNHGDSDGDPLARTFSAEITEPASNGIVNITLTNSQTENLVTRGKYVYDVQLTHEDSAGNDVIERVLEGVVEVSPGVS